MTYYDKYMRICYNYAVVKPDDSITKIGSYDRLYETKKRTKVKNDKMQKYANILYNLALYKS